MIILGVDPGTATTGYGVIRVVGETFDAVKWGLITTDKSLSSGVRFLSIYTQLTGIIQKHTPSVIAIEKVFFATNAKTAISVGQAQGVMFLCAAQNKVEVVEYAPGTIKKAISGDGRADKKMIQQSLRNIFGAKIRSSARKKTHFDNEADGLAVALTHALSLQSIKIKSK